MLILILNLFLILIPAFHHEAQPWDHAHLRAGTKTGLLQGDRAREPLVAEDRRRFSQRIPPPGQGQIELIVTWLPSSGLLIVLGVVFGFCAQLVVFLSGSADDAGVDGSVYVAELYGFSTLVFDALLLPALIFGGAQ